jgi:hypothetical protein
MIVSLAMALSPKYRRRTVMAARDRRAIRPGCLFALGRTAPDAAVRISMTVLEKCSVGNLFSD